MFPLHIVSFRHAALKSVNSVYSIENINISDKCVKRVPLLYFHSENYSDPPLISYEKGRSLKDILMKKAKTRAWESCRPIAFYIIEVDLSLVFHLIFCISL